MGAWIETVVLRYLSDGHGVAPYVGAWIETVLGCLDDNRTKSHPTWVRGLKLDIGDRVISDRGSHPTWVRGLKLESHLSITLQASRTLRGCVD